MSPSTHELTFPGAMTQRGLWLYVWKITSGDGNEFLYVGRTGDSSSLYTSSPFARMGQHLNPKGNANTLHRHLTKCGIGVNPEECAEFKMFAHGPLFLEPEEDGTKDKEDEFRRRRDIVAALEKALADALRCGGYCVLNTVHSKKPLCIACWNDVRRAFARDFCQIAQDQRAAKEADYFCDWHTGNEIPEDG